MDRSKFQEKYCIIGAGAAGLAASKYLKAQGIPFDIIEAAPDVGGIWLSDQSDSPVYKNTHLISPKKVQAFSGFPMPQHYPDYPSHKLALDYLRSYAKHFGLYDHIQFNTLVKEIEQVGNFWQISLSNGKICQYRGVIIANGHHSEPKYPNFPGIFKGKILHSKDYKTPEQLNNKRVLIVGSGQSAIDIVTESAMSAKETFHSTRRAFVCVKKYLFGKPTEQWQHDLPFVKNLPVQQHLKLLSIILPILQKLEGINFKKWQIPWGGKQKFIHPVVGDRIYQNYIQGDVKIKPNLKELKGDVVVFEDGTEEEIDLIIYATGYRVSFPFLDKSFLNWRAGESVPNLYLYIFHPEYDNLFFIGMVNPIGAHWKVFEAQSQLVAAYIKAQENNFEIADQFAKIKIQAKGSEKEKFNAFRDPQNYPLVIDKFKYLKELEKHLISLEKTNINGLNLARKTSQELSWN